VGLRCLSCQLSHQGAQVMCPCRSRSMQNGVTEIVKSSCSLVLRGRSPHLRWHAMVVPAGKTSAGRQGASLPERASAATLAINLPITRPFPHLHPSRLLAGIKPAQVVSWLHSLRRNPLGMQQHQMKSTKDFRRPQTSQTRNTAGQSGRLGVSFAISCEILVWLVAVC
jgi:hypothetical protein